LLPAAALAGWILPVTVSRTAAGSAASDQDGKPARATTASQNATNLFSIRTFDTELNEIPTKGLLYRKKLRNHVSLLLHSQNLGVLAF